MDDEDWTLTDARLAEVMTMVEANPCPRTAMCVNEVERTQFALHVIADKALRELQQLRAMVKRLEEWAEQMDSTMGNVHRGVGQYIAAELRNRMKGV